MQRKPSKHITYSPALLVLSKSSEETRYIHFDNHEDAIDSAIEWKKQGWGWAMHRIEIIPAGELCLPDVVQPDLL